MRSSKYQESKHFAQILQVCQWELCSSNSSFFARGLSAVSTSGDEGLVANQTVSDLAPNTSYLVFSWTTLNANCHKLQGQDWGEASERIRAQYLRRCLVSG